MSFRSKSSSAVCRLRRDILTRSSAERVLNQRSAPNTSSGLLVLMMRPFKPSSIATGATPMG